MTLEKANERLILSRRIIASWERLETSGGKIEDLMRMIGEEITILEGIVAAHPQKALTVGDLIRRYRDLGEQQRVRAN
jgi:hypothetical protein